jgi:hypothetical protein
MFRRGVAQSGSVPALGAGGRGFKSRRPDHEYQGAVIMSTASFFLSFTNYPNHPGDSEDYFCKISAR